MEDTRSERYFASTIGLPNYGLDPTRDCSHVRNEELRYVFGEKVQNKGYCYEAARIPRLVERVRELYPPCFQTEEMPEGLCIPESFARALISEVLYYCPMNWARYAMGRHKNKPVDAEGVRVLYMAHEVRKTYSGKMLEKLAKEIGVAEKEFEATTCLHRAAFDQLQKRKPKQMLMLASEEAGAMQLALEQAKEKLATTLSELDKLGALSDMIEKGGVPAIILWHQNEIAAKKNLIAEVEMTIRDMDDKKEEACAEDLAAAEEEEKRLLEEKLQKLATLENLKARWKQLEDRFAIPATRTPSRYMDDVDLRKKTGQGRSIQDCALCGSGFPLFDVILAPCFCVYHPWCAAMHTSLDSICACAKCKKTLPAGWLKSFGFYKEESPFKPSFDMDLGEGEKKRGHLNSDIGGLNYTPKKEKPSTSSRKKNREGGQNQ